MKMRSLTLHPSRLMRPGLLIAAATALAALLALARAADAPATPPASATTPTSPATQETKPAPKEASLPFVDHGAIQNFDARDDLGIYIQANSRKWYYGRFMSPCIGIRFATAISVVTDPTDQLDRWSKIYSRQTGACPLTSFVESEGPPSRKPVKKP